MCDFDTVGFISPELDRLEEDTRSLYPEYYKWILKVNQYCQELQYKLTVHNNDQDQVVSATLFARAVATYQAFILVCRRGMPQQAEMLLRCILECVFPLVAISKETGYTQKIIESEQHEFLRTCKNLIRFLERHNPNHPDIKTIKNKAEQAKQKISEHGFKRLTIFQNAEAADLTDWYDVVYGGLSLTTHASIRSLEESLVCDHKQKIKAIKSEPEVNDLGYLFLTSLQAMLYALEGISNIIKVDTKAFTNEIADVIKALYKAEKG